MLASIGSCAILDQCRESERVPCVVALALESTSRIGCDESETQHQQVVRSTRLFLDPRVAEQCVRTCGSRGPSPVRRRPKGVLNPLCWRQFGFCSLIEHPDSIVFSRLFKFCRDFMVSCEISSPCLQLLSQLGLREC